jgi:sarcosine oxidase subunit alpha
MTGAQPWRLASGGRIDRTRLVRFRFDGRELSGHPGDTLASALLANGVRIVGRGFKRHRPRGIYGIGAEEPNALVRIGQGAQAIPCATATQVELYDGLVAHSVNCWPSARFDLGGALDAISAFMPAGFYYKTFMAPGRAWRHYERLIRHAAGLGRAPRQTDPDRYERRFDHCDVLVIGAGPAGLAAALAAGATGARVLLVDEQSEPGGSIFGEAAVIGGVTAAQWVAATVAALRAMPEARLLVRATAFGYHDHNLIGIVERLTDHLPPARRPGQVPRQRLWKVRAREVVLATGSFERPLVFANNDTPGVMLAGAAAAYAERYAVRPGRRAVLFTDNDSAYAAGAALQRAGVELAAVVDRRTEASNASASLLAGSTAVAYGSGVVAVLGGRQVRAALVAPLDSAGELIDGEPRSIACDLVCVSGGWSPAVHLFSQSGGRLAFDARLQAFVPGSSVQRERSAGACNGALALSDCIAQGLAAGAAAACAAGFGDAVPPPAPACSITPVSPQPPIREVPAPARFGRKRKFVDILNDVSAADLALAHQEGYGAPELAKRYTTAGMGVDQGRTGNINALALLATAQGRNPGELGPTTFRAPYAPLPFGAMAGRDVGRLFDPVRRTPLTEWHEAHGALFEPVGRWRRPLAYIEDAEDLAAAVRRECLAARNAVTLCDASTLGKIDIRGPDAVRLLDMLYTNAWSTLAIGRCRYGVMLKDDGMVFDDGTTSRLAEHHYFMTTTSGHADQVADWIEEWLQCEWPAWRVFALPVTTQWATIMVSGPRARILLERVGSDIDLAPERCRFMSVHEGRIAGVPARVLRVSFTGELSYELYVPAGFGLALWERLMAVGRDLGIAPIGTEALHVLRAEKGFFVVGHDVDATVSALDLGIEWMIGRDKPDFIGKRSLARAGLARPDRLQFVGVATDDPAIVVAEGSPIIRPGDVGRLSRPPLEAIGRVTSSYLSPTLDRSINLGLVAGGRGRMGEAITIVDRGTPRPARICSPRFLDPDGARLNG